MFDDTTPDERQALTLKLAELRETPPADEVILAELVDAQTGGCCRTRSGGRRSP